MPPNNKSNITKFISKAKLIHEEKYDYSNSIYQDAITEMNIFCNTCKTSFSQKPRGHLRGQGCSNCARLNHRSSNKDFITKSQKIHGINTFNYSVLSL